MIPIVIVAHPKREAMGHALAQEVSADAVCWDVTHIGAEANHLQAWRWLADLRAEWGVVLEDDVIVCKGFLAQLTRALHCAPTSLVSLYLPRGRPPHWQESIAKAVSADVCWLTAPAMMSCQGYAMRTEFFSQHKEINRRVGRHHLPIDEAITSWLNSPLNPLQDVSYALPSLVDHRDGPTLIEHRDGPRDGERALMTWDSDPTGASLPRVRKSWLFGAHNNWNATSLALEIPLVLKDVTRV